MSIDRCNYCGLPVDTDSDAECYLPDPRMSLKPHPDICVCSNCRDSQDQDAPDEYDGFGGRL